MFLRTSISSTKKFFQKKLESFKYFISGGYERLPKSPPGNQWENENGIAKAINVPKLISPTISGSNEDDAHDNLPRNAKVNPTTTNHHQVERNENREEKSIVYEAKRHQNNSNFDKVATRRRNYFVAQKLKEIQMMDKSNVEHVLDIEEVLHYYSRLTCQTYRDIVNKFFMEMYAELFGVPPSSSPNNLKPRLQTNSPIIFRKY